MESFRTLLIFSCLSGVISQSISVFPQSPVGGTVGEPVLIECGITNRNNVQMQWTRVDLSSGQFVDIYNSISDTTISGYSVLKYTEGSTEYFNLQIDSASRDLAGFYSCDCVVDEKTVKVLIFEPPVFMDNDDDQLVEGVDTSFRCEVTYASPDPDLALFNFHMEDGMGSQLAEYNDTLDGSELEYRRIEYSNPVQLDYADDGQEYACVISMPGGYEGNTTLTLTVYHKASNVSLHPDRPDLIYYVSEEVTVLYSSNPYPAKQFKWYRLVSPGVWELIDGEEDNDPTITICDWPEDTTLKAEIINDFDHDGDGTVTDQASNFTFAMTIRSLDVTTEASTASTAASTASTAASTQGTTSIHDHEQERVPAISLLLTEDTAIDSRPFIFNYVMTNIGDGYSEISGVFTVPTHGLYHLSVSLLSIPDNAFTVRLMRNDGLLCQGYADSTGYQTGSCSVVVELFPADEVYVNCPEDDLPLVGGYYRSGLSGFLIQKYE